MDDANERLRTARRAAGFQTAADAAERNGWIQSAYRSHENGHRAFFDLQTAIRYARAFKVSPSWLLGLDDTNTGTHSKLPSTASLVNVLEAAMKVAGVKPPSQPLLLEVAEIVRETLVSLDEDQATVDDPEYSTVVARTLGLRRRRSAA